MFSTLNGKNIEMSGQNSFLTSSYYIMDAPLSLHACFILAFFISPSLSLCVFSYVRIEPNSPKRVGNRVNSNIKSPNNSLLCSAFVNIWVVKNGLNFQLPFAEQSFKSPRRSLSCAYAVPIPQAIADRPTTICFNLFLSIWYDII